MKIIMRSWYGKKRVNKSQDDEDDINHYGFDFGFK
jgi:hypothetical protein